MVTADVAAEAHAPAFSTATSARRAVEHGADLAGECRRGERLLEEREVGGEKAAPYDVSVARPMWG